MQLMLSSRIVIIFINSLVIDVMLLVDKLPRVVQSNKMKINTCVVVDPFFFFFFKEKLRNISYIALNIIHPQ